MSIDPHELEIVGKWVVHNGQVVSDEACKRINLLLAKELQKMTVSDSGWEVLYRDPNDGRYWELFHPQSEMHSGGPPSLRFIDCETASQKYKLRPAQQCADSKKR